MKIRQEIHPFGERDDINPEVREFDLRDVVDVIFKLSFEELGCLKITQEYDDGSVTIYYKIMES